MKASTKYKFVFFLFFWYLVVSYAPIAQLVEQIPLKDKVVGSIPTGRTNNFICLIAGMAELVYAHALGACGVILGSSSLPPSTLEIILYTKQAVE